MEHLASPLESLDYPPTSPLVENPYSPEFEGFKPVDNHSRHVSEMVEEPILANYSESCDWDRAGLL